MKKWSENERIKFIELYREHEYLWDVTKTSYRNNQMRLAALQKIVEEMAIDNFTINEARQKIKSLRNTYMQELQKVEKSRKSGIGSDEVYTPTLKWFKVMDAFMRKSKEKRQTQSNLEIPEPEQNGNTQSNRSNQEEEDDPVGSPNYSQNQGASKSHSQTPTPHSSGTGKRKRHQVLSAAVSELRQVNEALQQSVPQEDEFDIFGRHVAVVLRKLPTHLSLECENQLQAILTKFRLMAVSTSTPVNTTQHTYTTTFSTPSEQIIRQDSSGYYYVNIESSSSSPTTQLQPPQLRENRQEDDSNLFSEITRSLLE